MSCSCGRCSRPRTPTDRIFEKINEKALFFAVWHSIATFLFASIVYAYFRTTGKAVPAAWTLLAWPAGVFSLYIAIGFLMGGSRR